MLTVFQPLACIVKADWYNELNLAIVLIPATLCWIGLLISIIITLFKIRKFHKLVTNLVNG
jgi:hypothetical protein